MDVTEGNKLIAEFMIPNWELLKSDDYNGGIESKDLWIASALCSEYYEMLNYHKSWNLLMPVVDKCRKISEQFEFESEEQIKIDEDIFDLDNTLADFMTNNIKGIYTRVVEFIKWHNKNK